MAKSLKRSNITPLVFSTTGSIGKEGTTFYKRLADMLPRKQERPYSVVMGWIRCRLSFAIILFAITCIKGIQSTFGKPIYEGNLALAAADSYRQTLNSMCIKLRNKNKNIKKITREILELI